MSALHRSRGRCDWKPPRFAREVSSRAKSGAVRSFAAGERIFMEQSRKYELPQARESTSPHDRSGIVESSPFGVEFYVSECRGLSDMLGLFEE